jgi:hypothetical protein
MAHAAVPAGVKKIARFYSDRDSAFLGVGALGIRPPPQARDLGDALVPILIPEGDEDGVGPERERYVVRTCLSLILTNTGCRYPHHEKLRANDCFILEISETSCSGPLTGAIRLRAVTADIARSYAASRLGFDEEKLEDAFTPAEGSLAVMYSIEWAVPRGLRSWNGGVFRAPRLPDPTKSRDHGSGCRSWYD